MSVPVSQTPATPQPVAKTSRKLRIAAKVTYVIWGFVMVMTILDAIVPIAVVIQGGYGVSLDGHEIWSYVFSILSGLATAFVLWQMQRFFEETLESGTPFGKPAAQRMHKIALALVAFTAVEIALALAVAAIGSARIVGFGFFTFIDTGISVMNAGFNWHDIDVLYLTLSFGGLVLAAVAWGLSYVFEYGGYLQRENDLTV